MNYLSALFLAGLYLLAGTLFSPADETVTKAQALGAIAVFQKDPSGQAGFTAGATLLSFAKSSSAVHLSLSSSTVPWLKGQDESDADTRDILLSAYLAGNIRSQLKTGHARDDVYAGWEQVLVTYAQLLQINSAAKIAEVDELKKRETDGTLRGYAEEVAGQR
jgi:hypothetical protein